MSWDSYLDNIAGHAQGHLESACIIGLDGAPWTTAGHQLALQISPQESTVIANCMKNNDYSQFQASGIVIGGIKYQFLREDDGKCYAKKKDNGSITIQKSQTAVVIGKTKEGSQQGNVNKGVGVIAEYLESLGM